MRLVCVLFCVWASYEAGAGGITGPAMFSTPAGRYAAFALASCDRAEAQIPALVGLAETIADRHIAGGMIGVIWEPPSATGPQGPQYEIKGRSGGLMAMDVALAAKIKEADRKQDTAIIGWQREPTADELESLKKYHEKYFVIAFGPRQLPALAEYVAFCDVWIDTGLSPDLVANLPGGMSAGSGNCLANAINVWTFQAELVAALTRRGKMPTLLKSHAWDDAKAWNERYRGKRLFHDDLKIAPIAPGMLSRQYLEQIRGLIRTFVETQQPTLDRTANLIVIELKKGRKTVVAQEGHTTYEMVGKYEDAVWAAPVVLSDTPGRLKQYSQLTPKGALVLRLGYSGVDAKLLDLMRQQQQRIMWISSTHDPRPEYQVPPDILKVIDTGWAFGDACVQIAGYPIRVFPPSGVMQIVAYEAVNAEVLTRLATPWPPELPGAVNGTVTIRSPDFLTIPEAVATMRVKSGMAPFVMAKTPPTVELAYHGALPNAGMNSTGWTMWGDICVAGDGKVYCGIGDHGNNRGNSSSFIYCWNPAKSELTQIADLNEVSQPRADETSWSKVHAGIQEGKDGMIYFTGTLNDGGIAYKHHWTGHLPGGQIFRYNPATGKTDIVGSLPGQCSVTTLMDKSRNTLYLNFEGKFSGAISFSSFDLAGKKFVYVSPTDAVSQSRNLALARNGCVYFNGAGPSLWKYNPDSREIRATGMALPGGASMRSSTGESGDGWIYATSFGGKDVPQALFRFSPATETLEMLGPNFLNGDYVTVTALSSDGKYVYFLPGAHGSSLKIGTPVVQYEVKTGTRKVLAFLQEPVREQTGYVPCGTYGIKLSADDSTLYINFNGHGDDSHRLPKMQANGFGLTAFAAIHIPVSER